jgi:hypothetical protein
MATGNRRLISHPRNAEDHERPAFVGRIPFSPKGVHREVGIWHEPADPARPLTGRYRVTSGRDMLNASSSHFDPEPVIDPISVRTSGNNVSMGLHYN